MRSWDHLLDALRQSDAFLHFFIHPMKLAMWRFTFLLIRLTLIFFSSFSSNLARLLNVVLPKVVQRLALGGFFVNLCAVTLPSSNISSKNCLSFIKVYRNSWVCPVLDRLNDVSVICNEVLFSNTLVNKVLRSQAISHYRLNISQRHILEIYH